MQGLLLEATLLFVPPPAFQLYTTKQRMADDLQPFLDSRHLIGFQLDASHLHEVLHSMARQQQVLTQNVQGLSKRLQAIEDASQQLADRQSALDNAIGRVVGSSDDIRQLQRQVQDLSGVVDTIARQAIPELRRYADETRRLQTQLDRSVQQLNQVVTPLEQQFDRVQQSMEGMSSDWQAQHRQMSTQIAQVFQLHDDRGKDLESEFQRVSGNLRDIIVRLERVEKEYGGASRGSGAALREALEELNMRCNENFRQIEISAKAVDAELGRVRSDIANCRAELNAVDNNTRHKFAKITEDMDGKFELVISALQGMERNSSELEQHLAAAGKVLASRQTVPHASPSLPRTTTTTTSLRGGTLFGDVRSGEARKPQW